MFDKLKYNNLIISGSKEIQKAKIQVLRKIIQKIQKLKKSSEKRPDDENCKIKLRKCLEIVESAKKIKKFEVLTNILLLEKCPNKIVTNSRSTPEEVAIAMLASNQTMKIFLAKIRQELSLNEENLPSWRKTLREISKQKVKTQRRKKRKLAFEASGAKSAKKDPSAKKKKKKSKTLSDENQINLESEEKSLPEISNDDSKIENKSTLTKTKVRKVKLEPLLPNPPVESSLNNIEPKKSKKSKLENQSKPSNKFESLTNSFDEPASKKIKKSVPENVTIENESKSSNFLSLNNNLKKVSKDVQRELKVSKFVDPFFVTSSGENYVATLPVIETNNESTENDKMSKETRRDAKDSFKEFKKETRDNFKVFKPENEKMHPSWVAKQKQRTPVNFQGKRKVFDDDTKQKDKSSSSAGEMHPSWVAKQKLKPAIAAFQGKKIKFDDA